MGFKNEVDDGINGNVRGSKRSTEDQDGDCVRLATPNFQMQKLMNLASLACVDAYSYSLWFQPFAYIIRPFFSFMPKR